MKDIYPEFKLPRVKWWERVLLFFKPTYAGCDVADNRRTVLFYKLWRGQVYIVGQEVAPWAPDPGAARTMSEWISVKERLPETMTKVLVAGLFMGDSVMTINYIFWRQDTFSWQGFTPTHWMPLPAPPCGEHEPLTEKGE